MYTIEGEHVEITSIEKERQEGVAVYNFVVEDWESYFVSKVGFYVHNDPCNPTKGNGVPVKEKTKVSNGLDYQSNPKHTQGQPGNRPNAGIEPKNSLDLFGETVPSTSKPNQRFTYDAETKTLHRFYNDGNSTWHWSGSTNQGANSIKGSQVPNDIKNKFGLPKKGW